MGVEYYVVDLENRRSFTLGRSLDLSHLQDSLPVSPVCVYAALMDRWSKAYTIQMAPGEEQDWIAGVAARLWAFCESADWKVEFRSDCQFYDDEDLGGDDGPCLLPLPRLSVRTLPARPATTGTTTSTGSRCRTDTPGMTPTDVGSPHEAL